VRHDLRPRAHGPATFLELPITPDRADDQAGPRPRAANAVHVVVPDGIDDPARVSGGNRYDRRICDSLRDAGWAVEEKAAPGSWPRPDRSALAALARSLDVLPDGALVLVDGLIASASAEVLVPRSIRLRLVVLVHMPFGGDLVPAEEERAVLAAAPAVVTTSDWTRRHLLARHSLPPARVHVARPGTDPAAAAPGTATGGRLLCVAALAPHKGQDLLLEALAETARLPWECALVGPLDRDPEFVARLQRRAVAAGIADRVRFTGVLTGRALQREYRDADVLVLPSRAETYGMVVTEALAAGLPVIAAAVGGVSEAMGRTESGLPGLVTPQEDPTALARALRLWLTDPRLRHRLRGAARRRRETLPGWCETGGRIAAVLTAVRDGPS
jgi:glycosyltransferase involved in cell wall biosynthesis